jgi:hypothetical protein
MSRIVPDHARDHDVFVARGESLVDEASVGFECSDGAPGSEEALCTRPLSDEAPVDFEAEGEAFANVGAQGEALVPVTPSRHRRRRR